ncbi:MAG: hydrogenase maturation nickel metallochaperone HypA [Bacteroidales bacterium]|nr:hydrogenase maturation nickel metallochaperone HypA [Bacteroidales bacterium]
MHEFSIAQHIIEIALQTAKEHDVDQISSVEVEIGQAAGVVIEALEFAWESVVRDTPLQDAALTIKIIPVSVVCRTCGMNYSPRELLDLCPQCGDMNPEIIRGKELRVSAIVT